MQPLHELLADRDALSDFVGRPWEEPVRRWKERRHGAPVIGCFPVYVPVELIHAAGALPLGLVGAGGAIETAHADSRFQSFVCSIARSTLELGLQDHLRHLDGVLFPSICDVARNLWSVFQRNFPHMYLGYLHYPQQPDWRRAWPYYRAELDRLRLELEEALATSVTTGALRDSLLVYNAVRRRLRALRRLRAAHPEKLPLVEAYLLQQAATCCDPREYVDAVDALLPRLQRRQRRRRDAVRVVLLGTFCEKPPAGLLAVLEETGCEVVDEDLWLGWLWFRRAVPATGTDPLGDLAAAGLRDRMPSSVVHDGDRRGTALLERLRRRDAEAVVFCTPKFCEPALFDLVSYRSVLTAADVPHIHIEYEEKMWTFERLRTELETFVESLLFD